MPMARRRWSAAGWLWTRLMRSLSRETACAGRGIPAAHRPRPHRRTAPRPSSPPPAAAATDAGARTPRTGHLRRAGAGRRSRDRSDWAAASVRASAAELAASVVTPASFELALQPLEQLRVVVENQHRLQRQVGDRRWKRPGFGSQRQRVAGVREIGHHAAPGRDLSLGDERGERLRQHAMNRALQLPRAVFLVEALLEQQSSRRLADVDVERPFAEPRVHVPLQLGDVVIENGRDRLGVERTIRDDGIDPIDELRRKPLPDARERNALELADEIGRGTARA